MTANVTGQERVSSPTPPACTAVGRRGSSPSAARARRWAASSPVPQLTHSALTCNIDNAVRRYVPDAALPVYVLHQPVIVALALLVGYAEAATWWGLPALIVAATTLTFAIYELAVRRSPTLQYALGARPATKLPRRSRADEDIRLPTSSTACATPPRLAPDGPSC